MAVGLLKRAGQTCGLTVEAVVADAAYASAPGT
jgi:hypothetical protein